ncbi:hypothetical protein K523DRAFT_418531 [Schizophyllum commune Tattone D]|nr:hypothetical protein K523DRAFT_418531 [Schizophyllum commune Tattone D]
MPRKRTPTLASNTSLRRSARIRAKTQSPPLTTTSVAREVSTVPPVEQAVGRKRKASVAGQPPVTRAAKRRYAEVSHAVEDPQPEFKAKAKCTVRFADGEPLEPLSAPRKVTVEDLIRQAERSDAPEGDIREIACPDDVRPRIAPKRRRDCFGYYLKFPPIFVLTYAYNVPALFKHLRARGRNVGGDVQATMKALRSQMISELGLEEGIGFAEITHKGRAVYLFIMSCSDRPETLPFPQARVRKFQEVLDVTDMPIIMPMNPENVCI